MSLIFKIYQDKAGEWRWRASARNGRIVADGGEGYKRKRGCKGALCDFLLKVFDDTSCNELDIRVQE